MLHIPVVVQFFGNGDKGNGISTSMKTEAAWVDTVKNSCKSCHALGSESSRLPKVKLLGEFVNSTYL